MHFRASFRLSTSVVGNCRQHHIVEKIDSLFYNGLDGGEIDPA